MLDIVIPTLNSEKTLGATLESLRPLLGSCARVIVADSFSTDQTTSIAKSLGVEYISVAPGNMYAAINSGLSQGNNAWCTYINSDDLLYADVVRKAIEQDGLGCDFIYGHIDLVDFYGRFTGSWNSPPPGDLLVLAAHHINPVPQQGMIFRRSLWSELKGFDESYKYCADFHFVARALLKQFRFHRVDLARIAAFRIYGGQMSQQFSDRMSKEADRAMQLLTSSALNFSLLKKAKALLMFRLNNWANYPMRLIRHKQLHGFYRLPRTIY